MRPPLAWPLVLGVVALGLALHVFSAALIGYGVSLQLHRRRSYLLRGNIATSIDGGVFVDLAFDPVFELDPRVERR